MTSGYATCPSCRKPVWQTAGKLRWHKAARGSGLPRCAGAVASPARTRLIAAVDALDVAVRLLPVVGSPKPAILASLRAYDAAELELSEAMSEYARAAAAVAS